MIALPLGQMFYTVQKTTLASLVTFFVCNYVRLGLGRQTAQYRCTGSEGEIKEGDVRKPTPMAEQIRTRGVHKWRHHFELGWVQIWGFVQHFGGYNCTKVLWKLLTWLVDMRTLERPSYFLGKIRWQHLWTAQEESEFIKVIIIMIALHNHTSFCRRVKPRARLQWRRAAAMRLKYSGANWL